MDLEAYLVSNYMSKSKDYVYIYVFMCTFYLKTGDFFYWIQNYCERETVGYKLFCVNIVSNV